MLNVRLIAPIIVVLIFTLFVIPFLGATTYKITERSKVYYGNASNFSKPATVIALVVYQHIPEYQEIQRRGLKEDDPEYIKLMEKATKKFLKAVEKAAKEGGYDLVVEQGYISSDDGTPIPDITAQTIAKLEN